MHDHDARSCFPLRTDSRCGEREGGERKQLLVVTENGSEHIQSGVQSMRQGRRKTPAHHYFHRRRSVFLAFKIQIELPVSVGFANEASSSLIRCPLSVLLLCARRCWASPCCVCAPSPLDASPLARTTLIFWMISGSRGDGINSEMWVRFFVCIFNAVTFFLISCTPQPPRSSPLPPSLVCDHALLVFSSMRRVMGPLRCLSHV